MRAPSIRSRGSGAREWLTAHEPPPIASRLAHTVSLSSPPGPEVPQVARARCHSPCARFARPPWPRVSPRSSACPGHVLRQYANGLTTKSPRRCACAHHRLAASLSARSDSVRRRNRQPRPPPTTKTPQMYAHAIRTGRAAREQSYDAQDLTPLPCYPVSVLLATRRS